MINPFSLSFGKEPMSMINRTMVEKEIIDEFTSDNPGYQVCMITGVRGSGKTVSMNSISKEIAKDTGWVVVDTISEGEIIGNIVASLQANLSLNKFFKEFRLSISIPGVEISFGAKDNQITNPLVALEKVVEVLAQKRKKLLICIDEVVSNKGMKEFVSLFQILMRKNYPVFLIMTGLYENIYELQNEKSLTFLYRAPRVSLKPLSVQKIALKYQEIFNLSDSDATEMAIVTEGYPFAFQALGYLCFKEKKEWKEVIGDFDLYLWEFVYDKIWSELSQKDKETLIGIAKIGNNKVVNIRSKLKMSPGMFNLYRTRLAKKGLLDIEEYGYVKFALPRFREFILKKDLFN